MAILRNPRSQIPGSRFNPTELELINYLRRRIDRNKKSRYVTDLNVYEKEPWLLQHVIHPKFKKNVWFYFVTRKRPAKIKNPDSKRTSRVVGSCRWKTTGLLTHLRDEDGVKVGTMQSIVFKAKIEGKKDEINTGWVMHEFLLDKTGFQEVVLCRIEFKHENKNALYAPRLEPIVIGEADLVERKEQKKEDFMTLTDFKSLGLSMDLPKLPMGFQEPCFGSCSSETVPNLTAVGQESSYLVTGGIEQQQQNQTLGHFSSMEPQQSYGQGFGGVAHAYQNQYLGQGTNPWRVSMMNHDMAIMTRGMMVHQQEQCLAAQYQQLSMNRGMDQHQDFGSCGQFVGESLGQQQNQFFGKQVTNLSPLGQQQWNGYSGPYLAQPYDQGIVPVTHQDFNSSYLCLAQDLGQNNDLSVVPMETQQAGMEPQQHDSSCFNHNVVEDLATQRQHLGQESKLSLTQQQNQILGHLSPMEQQQNMNQALEEQHYGQVVPESAQLDLGQNIDLPKETQQQDNVVENLPTQLHLETNQEKVLPINQAINEPHGDHCSSSTLNESNQQSFEDETAITDEELELMMANFGNEEWAKQLGVNTPEEEAESTASLRNCNTYQSLLNYFCPI